MSQAPKLCVLLATASPQKHEAEKWGKPAEIHAFKAVSRIPEQPVGLNQTMEGALNRLAHTKEANKDLKYDYVISVENGLHEPVSGIWLDVGWIIIENAAGKRVVMTSPGFHIPTEVVEGVRKLGFEKHTIGDVLANEVKCNSKDVHAWLLGNHATRASVLADSLLLGFYQLITNR